MTATVNKKSRKPLGTATVMALGFLSIILLGTILLMLPISSAEGKLTSPLTAGVNDLLTTVSEFFEDRALRFWRWIGDSFAHPT